jgi:hypothetical protein
MSRKRISWTPFQVDKLSKILDVLKDLDEYKPLTLRQVYYQLVGKGYIKNTDSQYGMLSHRIKWARIDGYIAWEDIEDRVRTIHDLRGWTSEKHFVQEEVSRFLEGYRRDFLQSQSKYIEVWVEKDALSSIFTKVAKNYSVPVVVCRGFSSVTFLNEFRERISYYQNLGKQVVMLYFGDFDPSGMEMLETMKITLEQELGVAGVDFKRVALDKSDISKYNLPNDPNAIKKTDKRAKKFQKKYGKYAVELDALRPDILEKKIKEAIEAEIDLAEYELEIDKHRMEISELAKLKEKVKKMIIA